jgi:hypothetical protein
MRSGNGGQLNSTWVEALMGYPENWTDADKDSGMDRNYPEKWICGTWEDGIPRVTEKQSHRTLRLKGLGNSVVPLIPYLIFKQAAFDEWREK